MNERIRELAEQATEHDYTTWDSYNQKELVYYKFNKEKFAESIVRECAGIVADAVDHREPASTYVDKIKQHFGVEEWDNEDAEEEWDAAAALDEIVPPDEEPKGSQVNTPEGREWLRGLLRDKNVTIIFTKKEGSERKMVCTLAEDKIPSEKSPKNTGKSQSDEALAVFDVEKQDWRSFRWDSVKKIEFTLGE